MDTLRFTLSLALGIALPLAVQLWDRGRLSPAQRAGCWNVATWGAALYAFGPLSMLGWCVVTRGVRRDPRASAADRWLAVLVALGLGAVSAAAIGGVVTGADYLAALALGVPP